MNDWLITFFSLSVAGTLLILVLLLFKPICKKRLSQRWQYYIWLIVIARLLIPFAPETNLVNNLFSNISTSVIAPITNNYYEVNENISLESYPMEKQSAFEKKPTSDTSLTKKEMTMTINQTIGIIWIVVALILLIMCSNS